MLIGYAVISAVAPALESFTIREKKASTVVLVNRYANETLNAEDFRAPSTLAVQERLKELVRNSNTRGLLRVFVTDSVGVVLYSEPKEFIGISIADNPDVAFALTRRRADAHFEDIILREEQEALGAQEVFIEVAPITLGASEEVSGVLYAVSRTGLLRKEIAKTQQDMVARVSGGLLFLYAILFVIVWQASRTIRNQAGQLESYAKTLESEVRERTQELVEVNEQLIEQNKKLEKLDRIKDEFVANMSHELRSPLSAILGFTELLHKEKSGKLSERQKNEVGFIWKEGKHLLQLVNEILDLAKVGARKTEVYAEEFVVGNVINEAVLTNLTLAAKKNIKLQKKVEADVGKVYNDKLKFKQCLLNLVNNAVKFTDKGSVTIHVWLEGENLVSDVIDTGIGIKEENFKDLFEAFKQVDSTVREGYGGTGLGLAISQKFARLMGGDITVKGVYGKGSTFTLTIPTKYQLQKESTS